jgi:penicillin-binding protein 1C
VGEGYTVVVWTGRPDGGSRPGMTGREAALPLLFEVFDLLEANGVEAQTLAPVAAPAALTEMETAKSGPQLMFPPDGASVLVDGYGAGSRGLALAARGDDVLWYVDGQPLKAADGQVVWRPDHAGFYTLAAVDGKGRRALARVRIR